MPLQFRRGNAADLDLTKLLSGEPAYCEDTKRAYLADGAGGAMPLGNMFTQDYANGSGASNANKVDNAAHAIAADSATTATNAQNAASGSPLAAAVTLLNNLVNSLVGIHGNFFESSVPNGWLAAQGQAVSRTTYAALFTQIGTAYGTGDGSTTFNLPDSRGLFARDWDNRSTGGVDNGRVLGQVQQHQIQDHGHSATNTVTGASDALAAAGSSFWVPTQAATLVIGNPNSGNHGSETRPTNIALLGCIFTGVFS